MPPLCEGYSFHQIVSVPLAIVPRSIIGIVGRIICSEWDVLFPNHKQESIYCSPRQAQRHCSLCRITALLSRHIGSIFIDHMLKVLKEVADLLIVVHVHLHCLFHQLHHTVSEEFKKNEWDRWVLLLFHIGKVSHGMQYLVVLDLL